MEQLAETAFLTIDLKGAKILVVDDVSDNLLLISLYLRNTRSEVLQASNGFDAIKIVANHNPDLILMDIQMPTMDGFETVRRLRAGGFTKPILALTAHSVKEAGQDCLKAGYDGVITKPARKKELLTRLLDFLG